jgi:serine/threonine protein phosphatase PrpC
MTRPSPEMLVIPPFGSSPNDESRLHDEEEKLPEVADEDISFEEPASNVKKDVVPEPEEVEAEGSLASVEEIQNWEKTEKEIEATEIESFEGARVFVGMKNKAGGRPSEDYVVAVPEFDVAGVGDGVGGMQKIYTKTRGPWDLPEELNSAARASRVLSAVMSDRFGENLKTTSRAKAEKILKKTSILNVDPNIRKQQASYKKMIAPNATRAVEQLLIENLEAARKAAALVKTLEDAHEAIKKTGGQTTACIAVRHGDTLIVANVGDSMAFIERPNGKLVQVTREDTLLTHFMDVDMDKDGYDWRAEMERLRDHQEETIKFMGQDYGYKQFANTVLGGLGGNDPNAQPTLTILKVEPGARFIAVSDGVSDKFRKPDGSVDVDRLQTYLGRKPGVSPTDQIETAIGISAVEKTVSKGSDDDKTIAIEDFE